MRILTVVFDLGPGGTQRAAQNYSFGYAEAGHEVAVLGYLGGGPRAVELAAAGIETFSPTPGLPEDHLARAVAWGADLVHIHRGGRPDPQTGGILRRLREGATRPRVIETNVFGRVDHSRDRHLVDAHLHLSRWCLWRWRRWARDLAGPPPAAVIPYAVDTGAFTPATLEERAAARKRFGFAEGEVVFGRIGQPIDWKWHPNIFDAFERVARERAEARLFLVGLPSSLEARYAALSDPIRQRVTCVDFLAGDAELREGYAAMDTFLHASEIGETFGMVLAEAMLSERPPITLSRPVRDNSQLEVVGHEEGGLVVADTDAMVEAMLRLSRDPELRARLGTGGRRRIQGAFALPHVMEPLLSVVDAVTAAVGTEDTGARLRAVPGLITEVHDQEIEELLARQIGAVSAGERLQMALLHRPRLYRYWAQLKDRVTRLRQ